MEDYYGLDNVYTYSEMYGYTIGYKGIEFSGFEIEDGMKEMFHEEYPDKDAYYYPEEYEDYCIENNSTIQYLLDNMVYCAIRDKEIKFLNYIYVGRRLEDKTDWLDVYKAILTDEPMKEAKSSYMFHMPSLRNKSKTKEFLESIDPNKYLIEEYEAPFEHSIEASYSYEEDKGDDFDESFEDILKYINTFKGCNGI